MGEVCVGEVGDKVYLVRPIKYRRGNGAGYGLDHYFLSPREAKTNIATTPFTRMLFLNGTRIGGTEKKESNDHHKKRARNRETFSSSPPPSCDSDSDSDPATCMFEPDGLYVCGGIRPPEPIEFEKLTPMTATGCKNRRRH